MPLFIVDGGDFAWKSNRLGAAQLEQQRRKARLQLESFALMGMDAMVPGPGDLALGPDWLVEATQAAGTPLVASNLQCEGLPAFAGGRVVERDGVRVGIVGVLNPKSAVHTGCVVGEAASATQAAVAALGDVDLVVVLSRLEPADENALVDAVPQIDLVASGGSQSARPEPLSLPGGAAHIEAGNRGKRVGLATVELVSGGHGFSSAGRVAAVERELERDRERLQTAREQVEAANTEAKTARARRRLEFFEKKLPETEAELAALKAELATAGVSHTLEYQYVELGDDVEDHAATAALVATAKSDIEAMALKDAPADHTLRGPFVGTKVCQACHPAEATQWSTTAHARAWETLEREKRQMDMACYSCHATGAFHEEGPQTPAQVGQLANVGCESCHGPGREHVADPTHARLTVSPDPQVCVQCHDGDRDEGRFDLDAYLPKVRHKQ